MAGKDESDALRTLSGFSLDNVLGDLQLPAGSNRLGLGGLSALNSAQFFGPGAGGDDDDEAVGLDQGVDYEDQVDLELGDEVEDYELKAPDVTSTAPQRQKRVRIVKKLRPRPKSVYERFPAFKKDAVLDFSELFKGYTVNKSRLVKKPVNIELVYPRRKEPPRHFIDSIVGANRKQVEDKAAAEFVSAGNIEHDLRRAMEDREESDTPISLPLHDRSFDLVLLSNWEDQIMYSPQDVPSQHVSDNSLTAPTNKHLESGDWTQSIIWSPTAPFRDFTQIEFNHEDDVVPEERPVVMARPRKRLRTDTTAAKDKFNLSNDHLYEVAKDGGRHRVRQTFGQLSVDHAYPAQKLQLPFFKTRLSKQEARAFHRPALQFPTNVELKFTKVRTAKKKKDRTGRSIIKGGNVGESLHRPGDLTLKDTSNFVLWEFSEEHPPIVQNFGMGSSLVNYYRKKDDKDEHVPKYDLGVPFVLEPQDDGPFMRFGSVYPGQTIPAVYNNLIRAPLFRHKPQSTDFLVIRHTLKGESKFYIREVKNLFVTGQTYPVTEVPGPHSRKITNTVKHRLQVIAFKLLRKSKEERLKISRLMKYFPDQNELQMRQRLKEFMEYHRRGPHQGFWRLKEGWGIPSDAEMLKMVTPEQVVLAESMQVGQRHLQDAGYSQEEQKEADEHKLPIEQQLAPWITTKNFLYASQQKAMLRLHGEGDPSGRGEAFSFIRISMKDIFVKAGENYEQKLAEAENRPKSAHRYNVAEQQQIYKSEIERIWKAQFDSLSRKEPPQLTAEDERRHAEKTSEIEAAARQAASNPATDWLFNRGNALEAEKQPDPSSSADREMSQDPEGGGRRVLRIKRLVNGTWKTEIVRDPAVIRAYVKGRQALEEENTLTTSLKPTGNVEKDERAYKRLQEEIARMKKNQERRLHRKNAKIAAEGGTLLQLNRPIKPETSRHCGHCGQMGHMKTNRKCPRWAEFNSGAAAGANGKGKANENPPPTPGGLGFRPPAFGVPAVSSPLATSPPRSALPADRAGSPAVAPSPGAAASPPPAPPAATPKLKLTLKKNP